MREEIAHQVELAADLRAAGYAVRRTSSLKRFNELLEKASKNRHPDAKTIVVVDAHGRLMRDKPGSPSVITDGKRAQQLDKLARALSLVPGRTFLAINSCHFQLKPFKEGLEKGRLSVFSGNSTNPEQRGANHLPFFYALRKGLRGRQVVRATREAAEEASRKIPLGSRVLGLVGGTGYLRASGPEIF
ncbi:MAG: hypothetical protein AB1626_02000 [Candidatus Micrarchaeota archaeon]